jgi:hypothetical protein
MYFNLWSLITEAMQPLSSNSVILYVAIKKFMQHCDSEIIPEIRSWQRLKERIVDGTLG